LFISAIVGIVVGIVSLLIAIGIIVLVLIVLKRRRKRKQIQPSQRQQVKDTSFQPERQREEIQSTVITIHQQGSNCVTHSQILRPLSLSLILLLICLYVEIF
jgi:uncharacterized membrane protein YhiD involved in acid resistance